MGSVSYFPVHMFWGDVQWAIFLHLYYDQLCWIPEYGFSAHALRMFSELLSCSSYHLGFRSMGSVPQLWGCSVSYFPVHLTSTFVCNLKGKKHGPSWVQWVTFLPMYRIGTCFRRSSELLSCLYELSNSVTMSICVFRFIWKIEVNWFFMYPFLCIAKRLYPNLLSRTRGFSEISES